MGVSFFKKALSLLEKRKTKIDIFNLAWKDLCETLSFEDNTKQQNSVLYIPDFLGKGTLEHSGKVIVCASGIYICYQSGHSQAVLCRNYPDLKSYLEYISESLIQNIVNSSPEISSLYKQNTQKVAELRLSDPKSVFALLREQGSLVEKAKEDLIGKRDAYLASPKFILLNESFVFNRIN